MKIKLILFITLVLVLSSCSVYKNPISEDHSLVDNDTDDNLIADKVTYNSISADWPAYEDVEDLVEAGNIILMGKVTDISFQVLDDRTGEPPSEETKEADRSLYTIYDVDVIRSYKGDFLETTKVRMLGGQEGFRVDEQVKALGEDAQKGITIIKGRPEILIGESYLFVLYQYEDTIPTLVNMEQGVYDVNDPLEKDWYSFVSAKDIISYFGEDKWDEFTKENGGW
ncbi:MAG: hypothetical protein EWM47_11705 [Anaerolineaceae bacterium]|nr:MAG: hypothetical protein EWM47_11705 [Anaerolineaceae bacterium]